MRFMIRFDDWYRLLSSALLLLPSDSYIELDSETVNVRMGWGFRARFPRTSVSGTSRLDHKPLSRGVHGLGGRWLVNGSGAGIVVIDLKAPVRAYVMGFPIRLRQLLVSADDPDRLASQLALG